MFASGCDRTPAVSLQDALTGALIGLARATEGNEAFVTAVMDDLVAEALFAAGAACPDEDVLASLIARVNDAKRVLVPDCFSCGMPCGRNADYDMNSLWQEAADIRSLKALILLILRGVAAGACRAAALGRRDEKVNRFFYKALFAVGADWDAATLLSIITEAGEANLACMSLVHKTESPSGQRISTPEEDLKTSLDK